MNSSVLEKRNPKVHQIKTEIVYTQRNTNVMGKMLSANMEPTST